MHASSFFRRAGVRWVILVAALVLLAKAIFLVAAPIRGLGMTTWILDDAFSEMSVAKNFALGHKFSYDWVHTTGGQPLLWVLGISLYFWLLPMALAIKATFISSAILGACATVAVYVLTFKLTDDKLTSWVAFILITLQANAFFQAMNGMDTAIFTLLTIVTLALYVWPEKGEGRTFKRGILVGIPAGLAIMTRGDGIFLAGAVGLCECARLLMEKDVKSRKKTLSFILGFGGTAAICLGIFLVWQYTLSGSFVPANQVGRRELALSLHNFSFEHFSLSRYLTIVGWNVFQFEHVIAVAAASSLLLLVALVRGFADTRQRPLITVLTVYMAFYFGVLIGYQWYFADLHGLRYVNPAMHLLMIPLASLLVWAVPTGLKYRNMVLSGLIIVILALAFWGFRKDLQGTKWTKGLTFTGFPTAAQEQAWWGPIDWIHDNMEPGAIIGVRDNGRFAMFSGHPIQDLAGNIDPNVPRLVKEDGNALRDYLRSRNVSYVYIPTLEFRSDHVYRLLHGTLPLKEITEVPGKDVKLYRIEWQKIGK